MGRILRVLLVVLLVIPAWADIDTKDGVGVTSSTTFDGETGVGAGDGQSFSGGAAGIARVSGQNYGEAYGNSTDITIAFPGDVTVGSLITIGTSAFSTDSSPSWIDADCTKSAGTATIGTCTVDAQGINDLSGSYYLAGVFSALVTGSGSLTMQIHEPADNTYWFAAINEYSGSWDASRVEDTSTNTGSSASSAVTGTASSVGAALFVAQLMACPTTITAEAAFSLIAEEESCSGQMSGSGIDQIVGGATTDEGEWSFTGTDDYAAALVVYKES